MPNAYLMSNDISMLVEQRYMYVIYIYLEYPANGENVLLIRINSIIEFLAWSACFSEETKIFVNDNKIMMEEMLLWLQFHFNLQQLSMQES